MKKSEFKLNVQTLASPSDFEKNKHLIDVITSKYYDDYLDCLKCGAMMYPAFKSLDKIIEISRQTALSTTDIFKLIPSFRLIISIFDSQP